MPAVLNLAIGARSSFIFTLRCFPAQRALFPMCFQMAPMVCCCFPLAPLERGRRLRSGCTRWVGLLNCTTRQSFARRRFPAVLLCVICFRLGSGRRLGTSSCGASLEPELRNHLRAFLGKDDHRAWQGPERLLPGDRRVHRPFQLFWSWASAQGLKPWSIRRGRLTGYADLKHLQPDCVSGGC